MFTTYARSPKVATSRPVISLPCVNATTLCYPLDKAGRPSSDSVACATDRAGKGG